MTRDKGGRWDADNLAMAAVLAGALALGGGLAVLVHAYGKPRPARIVIEIRCPAGEAAVCSEMADAARAVALAKGRSAE